MKKDLKYYLSLPYTTLIEWSDRDECYIGSIVEIERNMTCGDTREEVLTNLKEALEAYLLTSLEGGFEIPEPVRLHDFKGKIAYRTTQQQHYEAFKAAKELGISLNAYIDGAVNARLAGRV